MVQDFLLYCLKTIMPNIIYWVSEDLNSDVTGSYSNDRERSGAGLIFMMKKIGKSKLQPAKACFED